MNITSASKIIKYLIDVFILHLMGQLSSLCLFETLCCSFEKGTYIQKRSNEVKKVMEGAYVVMDSTSEIILKKVLIYLQPRILMEVDVKYMNRYILEESQIVKEKHHIPSSRMG